VVEETTVRRHRRRKLKGGKIRVRKHKRKLKGKKITRRTKFGIDRGAPTFLHEREESEEFESSE
jgi:hypothetical protein